MTQIEKTLSDTFELSRALRAAGRVKAPASLLPAVLAGVGLSDSYWRLESPLGPVYVGHSKAGISMVSRARSAEQFERAFYRSYGRTVRREKSPPPARVRMLVRNLKSRERRRLRYDLRGLSEFERAVLLKALEIPDGEVRPYSWIAKEIGHSEAVRAVGSALAKNPVPLLIPCHRVVRADGHIGKYSMGGSRNKRTLLEIEGAQPETLEKLAASGVRYLGNQEQRHYCYPTCGGIETLVVSNKVAFHSEREAVAAGYHPCGDCRPLAA
ncbi:MAG: methylated-DNA--[protein]-cysteine S-methyltransferase [Thermoanaerobaculia bacterium]